MIPTMVCCNCIIYVQLKLLALFGVTMRFIKSQVKLCMVDLCNYASQWDAGLSLLLMALIFHQNLLSPTDDEEHMAMIRESQVPVSQNEIQLYISLLSHVCTYTNR